jgi:hypothetical protein
MKKWTSKSLPSKAIPVLVPVAAPIKAFLYQEVTRLYTASRLFQKNIKIHPTFNLQSDADQYLPIHHGCCQQDEASLNICNTFVS